MPTATLPQTGTWIIDASHSSVEFVVRHMVVSKVKGRFGTFEGTINVADTGASVVNATIDASSVDTGDAKRDEHLRSADFFDVANHPAITFRSTQVSEDGADFEVKGDLTIRGVTQPVTLALEPNGVSPDPWGGTRAGFSARTELNRKDYGLEFNIPIEGGGVVVGDKIKIQLEIEAVLQG